MVAGSVTSSMAMWAASTVHARLQQLRDFRSAVWHPDVPQRHITAAGMTTDVKRAVLVVFCLWPSAKVLVARDFSMICDDIHGRKRGHDSAQQLAEIWVTLLNMPTSPFVVGEVAY